MRKILILSVLVTLAACGGGGTVVFGGGSGSGGNGGSDSGSNDSDDSEVTLGATAVTSQTDHYDVMVIMGESIPVGTSESESGIYDIQTRLSF